MAKIELTDSQGNKYSLDVTDGDLFRIFNITKLSSLVGINKYVKCKGMPSIPRW